MAIVLAAAGWTAKTDISLGLLGVGFLIAFIGHAGGDGGFNWAIAIGWSLMVAGFVGVAWL